MDLLELLQGQMSEGLLNGLSQKHSIGDNQKTSMATNAAFSLLMNALQKNAQSEDGRNALNNALETDHDGGILDGFADILGGKKEAPNPRAMNGGGILKHVLGGNLGSTIDILSNVSGLSQGQSGNMLADLAPLVLGTLGKTKNQNQLNAGGILDLLTKGNQSVKKANVGNDLLTQILDRDGDGSVADDVTSFGLSFLGKLFKKK